MTRNQRQPPNETATDPGAERFWGQFAEAGRGRDEDHGSGPAPGAEHAFGPDAGSDPGSRSDATGGGHAAGHTGASGECLEWCPICRSAELIRTAVTPELREQAATLQREAIHVLQAFLAAYSERTGGPGGAGATGAGGEAADPGTSGPGEAAAEEPRVTDIPLD